MTTPDMGQCPVQARRLDGLHLHLTSAMGQELILHVDQLTEGAIVALFADQQSWLLLAFPWFNGKGDVAGFDGLKVREALIVAAAAKTRKRRLPQRAKRTKSAKTSG